MTDTEFADDLALLSDNISDTQELLERVETAAGMVGLTIKAIKKPLPERLTTQGPEHPTRETETG